MSETNRSMATKKPDFKALAGRQLQRDLAAAATGPDRFERAEAVLSGQAPRALPLDAILPRLQSTREVDPEHVEALTESIRSLGLIEPIVVDKRHRLLAGGHRLEAVRRLQETEPEAFARWFAEGVMVNVLEVDAETSPDRALEIEVAENEHRRDYTAAQVKSLAERLRSAGYRDTVGRPKAGEKALGPALEVIVQRSIKTIRKMLAEEGSDASRSSRRPASEPLRELRRAMLKHRGAVPNSVQRSFEELLEGIEKELANG